MAKSRASSSAGPQQSKPRSDAYVGLLFIALVAQIAAAVFLWLDFSQYPEGNPESKVKQAMSKISSPAGAPAAPPAPKGGNPVPPGK